MERALGLPEGCYATSRDCRHYPWDEIVREAQQVASGADISDLDYDTLYDTEPCYQAPVPGSVPPHIRHRDVKPQKSKKDKPRQPKPRDATPKEVLDAKRSKEKLAQAQRKIRSLITELENSEARNDLLLELDDAGEIDPIRPREHSSGLREAAAVVLCSDWHVEEVVDPSGIEYRNAFDPYIAKRRVERLLDGILWLTEMHRERFEIRDLVLWLGGDLLTGYIHEELEETNAMTPPEAVVFVQELIGGLIRALLERGDFERLLVPCNTGNHGRIHKRKRAKTGHLNSYEYIIYHSLKDLFADDPRVQFEIAAGHHAYVDVFDHTIRFHHGDDVRYWGGVGGLSIPLNKAIRGWQSFKPADLTCVGHFHQLLHGRDFVVNGSLIGYSSFALQIKAEYEPPQQAFFLMDKRRGRTCASPIWVEELDVDWSEWKLRLPER